MYPELLRLLPSKGVDGGVEIFTQTADPTTQTLDRRMIMDGWMCDQAFLSY